MWVQNVSENIARLKCKDQQKFLSEYRLETDKVENAPRTMGDGGHLEEVCDLHLIGNGLCSVLNVFKDKLW